VLAVWTVVLVLAAAALAQAPDAAAPAPPSDSEGQPPAAAAIPTTQVVDTPTRRPTRLPTPTSPSTAVPTEIETATPPSTMTMTPTRLPTATGTVPPTATSTVTPALLALALTSGGGSGALLLALGGGILLLAMWLGARIAGGRDRAERGRARRTIATTMLLELRRLDAILRRVVALENPTSFPSLDHPIMEAALRDLTLFHTATAARIAQFHGALRGIQHEIGDYRDNPLRWAGRLSELNQLIKTRAAAACRAVPELVKALEKEGGSPPPHLGESAPSASAQTKDLPPPPFGAGEGDDWTL
jgi:hypothetical protein